MWISRLSILKPIAFIWYVDSLCFVRCSDYENTPEARRSFPGIVLPSFHTPHSQPPQARQYMQPTTPLLTTKVIAQENILIDRDFPPRLADYGFPLRLDVVEGECRRYDDLQYLAPELLNPSSFGLRNRTPTKESDVFAFGMVTYQARYYSSFREWRLDSQLGAHGVSTVPRNQTLDHRQHRHQDTTVPPPRFQRVAFE